MKWDISSFTRQKQEIMSVFLFVFVHERRISKKTTTQPENRLTISILHISPREKQWKVGTAFM
jgi:hypothetical protein